MVNHRWSGWPGAICLDCFIEDQLEICVGEHDESLKCVEGHVQCGEGHLMNVCREHVNPPCSGSQGSRLHLVGNYYAGIGSRSTPKRVCDQMENLAAELARLGWYLRSGGAEGADIAFEKGHRREAGHLNMSIYLPWSGFNNSISHLAVDKFSNFEQAFELARNYHPYWSACSGGARKLHTRNVYQVLGDDLKTPSKFILCWTKNGKLTGGTAQALRIAAAYHIPVINLGAPDGNERAEHVSDLVGLEPFLADPSVP